MSLAQFEQTMNVNLTGSFLVIRAYLRRLGQIKERNGADDRALEHANVVLIGSTAGEFGEANHAGKAYPPQRNVILSSLPTDLFLLDYAASKSALTHGLMLSLKNEIVKIAPKVSYLGGSEAVTLF